MAVYPSRIPAFVKHRNLLDDVDANHINYIQDEVNAISRYLGPMPHVYNDVATDLQSTAPEATNDPGGVDTLNYTTDAQRAKVGSKPRVHANVSSRLDYIERGQQNHCFTLIATGVDLAPMAVNFSNRPRGIRFPAPGPRRDPFGMFNGIGVTLRKSGFWMFNGNMIINTMGNTIAANTGTFQAVIDIDGGWIEGMDRRFHELRTDLTLSVTRVGFFTAGSRISFRLAQNTPVTQRVRRANLSGVLLREDL